MNVKVKALAMKAGLKVEQDKIVKLQTHNLSYFLGKNVFCDDGFLDIKWKQNLIKALLL